MLEKMLDGKVKPKKQKRSVTAKEGSTTALNPNDSTLLEPKRVMAVGSLADAKTFISAKKPANRSLLQQHKTKPVKPRARRKQGATLAPANRKAQMFPSEKNAVVMKRKSAPQTKSSVSLSLHVTKKHKPERHAPLPRVSLSPSNSSIDQKKGVQECEQTSEDHVSLGQSKKGTGVGEVVPAIFKQTCSNPPTSNDPSSQPSNLLKRPQTFRNPVQTPTTLNRETLLKPTSERRPAKIGAGAEERGSKKQRARRTTPKSSSTTSGANFVRQNLKNNAGACRGARNKKKKFRMRFGQVEKISEEASDEEASQQVKQSLALSKGARMTAQSAVDPLDDYLDGSYQLKAKRAQSDKSPASTVPRCGRHQRPCKLLTVKKNSGNKGRKFYVCASPRGEQCDHFEWADNTLEVSMSCGKR